MLTHRFLLTTGCNQTRSFTILSFYALSDRWGRGIYMKEILNTLYVTKERAYLHLDHDTIRMEVKSETPFRMPLLHLGSIVCFGDILLSPALLHRCAEDGRSIVLLDQAGRF